MIKNAENIFLESAEATVHLGHQLGSICFEHLKKNNHNIIIFLKGELGAGKTTLTRGFLNAFGYSGNVKSPTYTLVEPYELNNNIIYHFDLYRLSDPQELEFMGIRDYLNANSISLIEWPQKADNFFTRVDLVVSLCYEDQNRIATIKYNSLKGEKMLTQIK